MKDQVLAALRELFEDGTLTIETSVGKSPIGYRGERFRTTVDTSVKINGEIIYEHSGKFQPVEN